MDRSKIPAYDGTLVTVRDAGDSEINASAPLIEEAQIEIIEETRAVDTPEKIEQTEPEEPETPIDYSKYDAIIEELKGAR